MEKMHIQNADEIQKVVFKVFELIPKINTDGATVLALHGELGAGKTTFVQALARELGVVETVTSPTFVIMKGYDLEDEGVKMTKSFSRLVHIDAYRIENIDEMRVLGFEALLSEKDTIICIEWAENITSLLPEKMLNISIDIAGEGRDVTIQ